MLLVGKDVMGVGVGVGVEIETIFNPPFTPLLSVQFVS